jgi:type VI secretion system secreted protein VgrG
MSAGVSPITQAKRFLSVDTPLGKDALLIERCAGSESVSGLFSFQLDLLLDRQQGKTQSLAADSLIAKKITIGMELEDGQRCFNGIVKRLTQGHRDERFVYYTAEVVPWLWLLTLKTDCRIFQNLSTPEIVKKVFDELKQDCSELVAYRDETRASYVKWDYCVQYRETSFNFISRLLEQDGIFYYFEHASDKHTLVLADTPNAFQRCAGQPAARFQPEGGYAERQDTIATFHKQQELRPGKFKVRDHHFEMPSKTLEKAETSSIRLGGNDKLEIYDYPGEYAQRFNKPEQRLAQVEPTGEQAVRIRMEEEEVAYETYRATSSCRGFSAGSHFELTNHHEMNGKYVLLSLQHTMVQNPHYVSDAAISTPYQNSFVAIPYGVHFRPPRVSPKPVVQGPQTAVVTVMQGEESWLDKYGRVRVQFHWDREGKNDGNSTCWLRVTQPWAGNTWGAHFWPRVGQEVIVDFLEGDPDQPIITGCVYNAAQMPPYPLPQYYTRSGIKTRSSKQGGSANYNEIRLEDKKGSEQIFINAEKDMDLRVENDSREFVGNDSHQIVKGGRTELVEKDKHTHLKADYYEQVDANVFRQVGSDEKQLIKGNQSHKVNGWVREKVGQDMSLDVGTSYDQKVGQKCAVEAGQEIHLKGGMKVIIEGGMQVSIKGPGGFVDIGPAGVTIQGIMVKINSGGAAGSGSGCSPKAPEEPKAPKDPDIADDGSKGGKL